MKFIHTSDWHLGITRRFLAPEEQGRFTGDRLDAVREIAKVANEEACDFVVVCGDVFESNQVDRKVVLNAIEAMKSFVVPVLILPGNHDAYDPTSVFRSEEFARRPENIVLLEEPGVYAVPGLSASVIAAPLMTRTPTTDLAAKALEGAERAGGTELQLLVAHGVTSDLNPDQSAIDALDVGPMRDALSDGLVDYIALGDRHSKTTVAGDVRIRYSGTPVSTGFGEAAPNNILVVENTDSGLTVQERIIGRWAFVTGEFEVSGDEDLTQIEAWLDSTPDKHQCVAKFSVVGTLSLEGRVQLDDMIDRFSELFAALWLRARKSSVVVEPSVEDLESLSLSGYAAQTVEELAAVATSQVDAERDTASDALALLYRLAAK